MKHEPLHHTEGGIRMENTEREESADEEPKATGDAKNEGKGS